MRLYNTRVRGVEEFVPVGDKVKIYTCGPTVYSYQHVGNYAAYVYWDTLVRAMQLHGWEVERVLNITDVGHLVSDEDEGEDKLEKGAAREGKTVWDVAEFYTDDFLRNFRALGLVEPTRITKATDYIEAQMDLVDRLSEGGYTYELSDGIYYDTAKFPKYAEFARLDVEGLRAEGGGRGGGKGKRQVTDFAVWKFILPGERHAMRWEYRGREGYPGWHLECSAIIHATLGEPLDIHTGGIEHIMVHHTNEIAQSEAGYGRELARVWLHNNHLTVDGEKISKSLGNVYDFGDLAERGYGHMDFRMWVLLGHYQAERNFSFELLEMARRKLVSYRNWAVLGLQGVERGGFEEAQAEMKACLYDNLNTAGAVAVLDSVVGMEVAPREGVLEFIDGVLGLGLGGVEDISDEVKGLIATREEARGVRDWARADELRGEIEKFGITVLDRGNGSVWQYL